jgi:hypothetical protein
MISVHHEMSRKRDGRQAPRLIDDQLPKVVPVSELPPPFRFVEGGIPRVNQHGFDPKGSDEPTSPGCLRIVIADRRTNARQHVVGSNSEVLEYPLRSRHPRGTAQIKGGVLAVAARCGSNSPNSS